MTNRAANQAYDRRNGVRPRHLAFTRPFPLRPLLTAIRHRVDESYVGPNRVGRENEILGINRRMRNRLDEHGLLVHQADRLAARCGWHPVMVWADWFDVCAAENFYEDMTA